MMYAENSVRLSITIALILTILFNIDKPVRMAGAQIQPLSVTNTKKELPNTRSFAHQQKRARVSEAYGKLPIRFEANNGQTAPEGSAYREGFIFKIGN